MSAESPYLEVSSLFVHLGGFSLRDVNLISGPAEYHILLGPTGSGKSTLLKSILGFHKPASGSVLLLGQDITAALPEHRKMGYVPQNYALFPHMNVVQNIQFGMKASAMTQKEADKETTHLLDILGIEKLKSRRVGNLSGGERQKVALARALGIRPKTVLLDEPFSAVDEGAKRGLWFDLLGTIQDLGITALHVTHNLEEAETLASKVSVLINGEIAQSGTRQSIFEHPKSEAVAKFIGMRNIISGKVEPAEGGSAIDAGHFSVRISKTLRPGNTVKICIRPQDIKIVKPNVPVKDGLKRNVFHGTIVRLFSLIDHCIMAFRMDGSPESFDLELKFPRHIKERYHLEVGHSISVALWEPKIIIL